MTIGIFVGTRPDIIKLSPVISELGRQNISYEIIHTGQHYDPAMSEAFFRELAIPEPDYFLGNSSQTSDVNQIASNVSIFLRKRELGTIVTLGDTNSALGVALAGCLRMSRVAHIEAGCRSYDRRMPEELNRVLISDCASMHFAPTKSCLTNLIKESVPGEIVLTGHPIVDLLQKLSSRITEPKGNTPYILLTLHRPENVDDKKKLEFILRTFGALPVHTIFPVHPRTRKNISEFGMESNIPKNISLCKPIGYLNLLENMKGSLFVATDSGGIQQEAYVLKVPCLTIRRSYEWVETFEAGVNILANPENPRFPETLNTMVAESMSIRDRFSNAGEIFGDGTASAKIVSYLKKETAG